MKKRTFKSTKDEPFLNDIIEKIGKQNDLIKQHAKLLREFNDEKNKHNSVDRQLEAKEKTILGSKAVKEFKHIFQREDYDI